MSFTFKKITALEISNATFDPKNSRITKLGIGSGLFLYISKTNKKSWYLEYKANGQRTNKKLGEYPAISLRDIKQIAIEKKLLLKKGLNPSLTLEEVQKGTQVKKTFREVYEEFLSFKTLSIAVHKPAWSETTANQQIKRSERYLLPFFAERDIADISHKELKSILVSIQNNSKALEVRDKVKTLLNMIFEFALDEEYRADNPMKLISNNSFVKKTVKGMKFVDNLEDLKVIKSKIDRFHGCFLQTKIALKVLMHTFLRPGELVAIEWPDVDFKRRQIVIPDYKMKMKQQHIVPMSKQVTKYLNELRMLTGEWRYVFASPVNPEAHISRDLLSKTLRDYRITTINPHGFRHTASTILNNKNYDSDAIELQLSHKIKGIRGIYNKADKLSLRKKMMQDWSDFIEPSESLK